jgi:hypothetical protein
MPEIGRLSREQAAALAGLAPYDHDSGDYKGVRRIEAGRARLRRAVYTPALPAAFRWNLALMALYRRLTVNGKPHKVELVACARRLIIYANTVVARGNAVGRAEPCDCHPIVSLFDQADASSSRPGLPNHARSAARGQGWPSRERHHKPHSRQATP